MVYGESGQLCLSQVINSRLINFWAKVKFDDTPRLSKRLFLTMNTCHGSQIQSGGGVTTPHHNKETQFNFDWFDYVKRSLSDLKLANLWYTNCTAKYSSIERIIKRQSKANFYDKWLQDIDNNSQCGVYKLHKRAWGMSGYLNILDAKRRVTITKFLTKNHFLPINANRFKKPDEPVKSVLCTLCPDQAIGDEIHYLLHCRFFDKVRKLCPLLSNESLATDHEAKFGEVFACNDRKALTKLSKFISIVLDTFTPYAEDEPLTELPIRKSHVTRAGRTSVRPKHLNDFFV